MRTQTVTVLFTDLVGSTALFSGAGGERAERLRGTHFGVLRHEVDRHRGRVVKTLGDGVMAAFGSARDGIQAALAMQARVASTGLRMRIGLASGDVYEQDGDCFGSPVVEAARLCALAEAAQVLLAESTRLLARTHAPLVDRGEVEVRGLPDRTRVWEAPWSAAEPRAVRVVLADDSVLIREGVGRVLEERGIEVLGQAADADELLRLTAATAPDLAILDVRMPPTWTQEGVVAAETILRSHPETAVLILSQEIEPAYADRLLAAGRGGVGYLLKERVADVDDFAQAVRRVAGGEVVLECGLSNGPASTIA